MIWCMWTIFFWMQQQLDSFETLIIKLPNIRWFDDENDVWPELCNKVTSIVMMKRILLSLWRKTFGEKTLSHLLRARKFLMINFNVQVHCTLCTEVQCSAVQCHSGFIPSRAHLPRNIWNFIIVFNLILPEHVCTLYKFCTQIYSRHFMEQKKRNECNWNNQNERIKKNGQRVNVYSRFRKWIAWKQAKIRLENGEGR